MVDILAFGAHPDDVEFACGGILAKMAAQGKKIVIVDLTLGQMSTHGESEERRKEGIAAAALIGAERAYLDFIDCQIIDSYEGRLKLAAAIRTYRPSLVLAPLWRGEVTHPDHLACGLMARYACRYARFRKVLPDLPLHRVKGILHYLFPSQGDADFLIDISDHVETWKAMISCHVSQIQTLDYLSWNMRAAAYWGVLAGCSHAQGLVKGSPVIVDDLCQIQKGTIEI